MWQCAILPLPVLLMIRFHHLLCSHVPRPLSPCKSIPYCSIPWYFKTYSSNLLLECTAVLYILLVVQFISGYICSMATYRATVSGYIRSRLHMEPLSGYIRSHYHFGTSVSAPSGHIRATQMEMITALNRKQENKLNNHMLEWNSLEFFAED